MSRTSFIHAVIAATFLAGGTASADMPRVVTDIAPVQSLVARVMDGVGTPTQIVENGASPHSYSLSPSEARAMQEADVVFWIGAALAPALERSIASLAPDASSVALLDAPGTVTHPFRTGATFGVEDHDDHGAEDDVEHDAAIDPHAWLDPENGKTWLDAIAAELSRLDPEHAEIYAANAGAGREEIDAAMRDITATLAPVEGLRFVVFHDAYQYFEHRFGIPASGAISLADASAPSPARIREIRDLAAKLEVRCVFAEPEFNSRLIDAVFQGTGTQTGIIDPLGSAIPPGPDFYPRLLHAVADELAACE